MSDIKEKACLSYLLLSIIPLILSCSNTISLKDSGSIFWVYDIHSCDALTKLISGFKIYTNNFSLNLVFFF